MEITMIVLGDFIFVDQPAGCRHSSFHVVLNVFMFSSGFFVLFLRLMFMPQIVRGQNEIFTKENSCLGSSDPRSISIRWTRKGGDFLVTARHDAGYIVKHRELAHRNRYLLYDSGRKPDKDCHGFPREPCGTRNNTGFPWLCR